MKEIQKYKIHLLLILLLIAPFVNAKDDVTFTASVATKIVAVGELFQLTYTLNTSGKDLRMPQLEGFQVIAGPFTSTSSSVQHINGDMISPKTVRYTYTLLADKQGTFTIAPASIIVKKNKYHSNSLSVKVIAAEDKGAQSTQTKQNSGGGSLNITEDNLYVRAVPSRTKVNEQEAVLLTYKIYSRVDLVDIRSVKFPELKGLLVNEIDPNKNTQADIENIDGKIYTTYIIRQYLVFPQKSGKIEVQPFTCDAIVRVRQKRQSRGFFDDFFDSYQDVAKKISSNKVVLNVESLPQPKPKNFDGAVGKFSVTSDISAQELKAHESLNMKMLNTITTSETAQNANNIWIIAILFILIIVIYLIYLIAKYNKIQEYANKLSYEIKQKPHDYNKIYDLTYRLQTKLNNKFYILKHNNITLLINKAKIINNFKVDLNNFQIYIHNKDNYSSDEIIKKYENLADDYLNEEICLFKSLCDQYKKQEILLKDNFRDKISELSRQISNSSVKTLTKEVRNIERSVKELVTTSCNYRYLEYVTEIDILKSQCNKLVHKVEAHENKIKQARQQAKVESEIKILISNFSEAIDSKDIDKANKFQSEITSQIHKSNDLPLKEQFAIISNNYNKQKLSGISVFEKECYVNYELKTIANNIYPIIRAPKKGCIVWPHRRKQIARRGYTEETFEKYLTKYLSHVVSVFGDVNLLTQNGSLPYEPDIAVVDLNSGCNLRIDIEIDEPYAGFSNKPTHYVGCGDEYRDANLNRLGWIVIRFSEYQIHTQPYNCVGFICRIISCVIKDANINQKILQLPDPQKEHVWEQIAAQKWANDKYRQKYLNHEFKHVQNNILHDEDIKLTTFEQTIKCKVEVPLSMMLSPLNIGYNKVNENPQDNDIKFNEKNHTYSYYGTVFKAVSTIVSEFFPIFDKKYWAEKKAKEFRITTQQMIEEWENKGNFSKEIGTFLHNQIENYYLNKHVTYIYNYFYKGIYIKDTVEYDIKAKEFQYFLNFQRDKSIKPYRTEWRIYCKYLKIAGTIDLITQNGSKYDIYDWKRSDKVNKANPWQNGLGELSHLQDTRLNHYNIQQNLYRWILEKDYNIVIGNMYLVILHPTFENYRVIEVPRMDNEINYIINNL